MKDYYYGEFKTGIFGKRQKVSIYINGGYISGTGTYYYLDEYKEPVFEERAYRINYEDINKIEIIDIKKLKCLRIMFMDISSVVNGTRILVFPNLESINEVAQLLNDMRDKIIREKNEKERLEKERRNQMYLEKKKYEEDTKVFFRDCMEFHIERNNNPYFELKNEENKFVGIYIDSRKNLNFLSINAVNREESNAVISYDKIHYYEKAGSIHYASEFVGKGSSFGGSLKGGMFSKKVAAIAGLLFGPMGMATGALFSHKPMQIELPSCSVDFSSETIKIDDRSVILNYYSDVKQQLLDIELPSEIYNFLQTHIPDKRYGIVLELEKNNVIDKHYKCIEDVDIKNKICEIITDFENRLDKLISMKEKGLLSESEFNEEKAKILNSI